MSGAVGKALSVMFALAGHEVQGLTNNDIAAATGLSASAATQYRQVLQDEGMVEAIMPGRYRLTPKIVQVARDHHTGLERMRHMVSETEQRYSRSSR